MKAVAWVAVEGCVVRVSILAMDTCVRADPKSKMDGSRVFDESAIYDMRVRT